MKRDESLPLSFILTGHVVMLVMLFLALWFAEERVLLVDSAYQLFYDINTGGMLINDSRFSMVLSQLLPWTLIKLQVPMRWLIIGYSASFMLITYACFVLSAHVLKNRKMAMLMIFTFLGMCSTFFHSISETFQLMFYAPLLYALMCWTPGCGRRVLRWVALVLVETLAFFIHPVAVFFILFLVGYSLIDGRRLRPNATVVVMSVVLLALVGVKMLVGQSGHDESFMPTRESVGYALSHFFSLSSFRYFRLWFPVYLFPVVLWVLTLVGYARQHLWLKMAYVGLYVLGFFVMSVVVYWQGDGSIGMERTYLPLYFFMGLPFLSDEFDRLKGWHRWTVVGYFTVMLLFSFIRLGADFHHYTNRIQEVKQIASFAREQGQHKLIITDSTANQLLPVKLWGLALESMMLTARDGADQTVTVYIEDDDFARNNDDFYDNPEVYMSVNWWKRWEVKDLNPRYFRLPAQGYKELRLADGGYALANIRE